MEGDLRNSQGLYLLLLFSVSRVMCVSIHYSVPEEKKSGSLVANVLEDLKLGIGELSARRAQLVSKSSKQYFHFDARSGNLLISDKIDREAVCGQTEPCLLFSQIVLEDPLEFYSIDIRIEDVNDNAPIFSKREYELEIPESVPRNTKFPLESAQDEDLGENSIQNYTLSANEHFKLGVESNKDGSKYVDLIVEKPLDRERDPFFGLTLMAVDGGVPQRTGTVRINIRVLDINDNLPQFTQSEYRVRLKENSPRDTLVSKVEARDLDFGSNAQITYSFHRVPRKILDLFHLNEMTGEITVWGEIDYEKESSYDMSIKATDGGGLSGQCKVLVEVEDMNDSIPEVSVISLKNIIREDSPLETVVALFSVTDEDSGDNGKTACSVEMKLPFVLKATKNDFYQLVIQSALDREKIGEYNVTITATDRGSPRLTSTRLIHVQISDVNDNTPVFEKSLFELTLQENNIPGLLIGLVHAVDLDMEQNGKVTYSLLPGEPGGSPTASYISINSETGNMYALRSLDYEHIKDFKVTVRATDGGIPPLSSDVVVQILVTDENDNAPFFLYPLQNSTSPCNELLPKMAEAGYLVTKVVAVDRDSGQNSWLSYELLKATDPGLFSIGTQNGEVKTRRPLTERDSSKQRLIIAVRDNGVPPQTSTATLNVLLVEGFSDPYLKVVDVHPQEHEDEGTLTMYLVICLVSVSSVFLLCIISFVVIKSCKKDPGGTFIAAPPHFPPSRPDIPENCTDSQSGSLSRNYQYDVCLTGGSLSSEFRFLRPLIPVFSVVDSNIPVNHMISSSTQESSEQIVNKEAKKELHRFEVQIDDVNDNTPTFSENEFILEIPEQTPINTHFPLETAQDSDRAADGEIPKRTGTAEIIIEVLDTNDNVPQFVQSVYRVKLMENSPLDTLVTKVEASDRDIGSNAHITYSFNQVQENVLKSFMLNKNTGELSLGGTTDYEEVGIYEMNIRATDRGGLSDYCKVIVEVEDENDNAPEVTITSINGPLPEDSPVHTVVALFSVIDRDSEDNGRSSCTTEMNLPFQLKATENNYYQLVTQQPLDRECVSEYNITITATDRGSPKLTSRAFITIQISDINDNPPAFERSFYDMHVQENNIPGFIIGSVQAVDLDTEQNAQVTYSLLPGKVRDGPASSYISINSETGNLYVIRSLDFEEIKVFSVTIQAVDNGSPSLSTKNSTSPSNDLVPRGADAGYLVTKVVAVDRDSGQNSWLSYHLLKATEPGLFMVEDQNGEVKTLRPVNKRDAMMQNLIVVVRDNGHLPLSASTSLRILLVDALSDPYINIRDTSKEEMVQEEDHNLTKYLIICLAAISSVFLLSLLVFITIKIQKQRKLIRSCNSTPSFPVRPNS
ncbi:hypothetical protein JD844_017119 [Phrynosoma platyrhinos]|uniref:Cadherin domain-containing protein n=1 Tax=Phrynosoma platyrhinos TaxID=52577 RepID=A0ABQ7SLE1_PHRPL|nr:hypothetical protein JD844_017119 [Phrynosoma platyrhinos]